MQDAIPPRNGEGRPREAWWAGLRVEEPLVQKHAPDQPFVSPGTSPPMTGRDDILVEITPQVLLKAYAVGIFPMAESAEDPSLFWIEPETRGVIPLDAFHVPKRLRRTIASDRFEVRVDSDFFGVIDGCAGGGGPDRPKTWINVRIRKLYGDLFSLGHCHTVETWQDGVLVGGLYGVHLGAAFFGESMFSRARD